MQFVQDKSSVFEIAVYPTSSSESDTLTFFLLMRLFVIPDFPGDFFSVFIFLVTGGLSMTW
jgi:hypothetical protein